MLVHPAPSPVYHRGELQVQERCGVRESSERVAGFLRTYVNEQHALFFAELSTLHIGARLPDGTVWASTVCGRPGFLRALDQHHFQLELRQGPGDPVRYSPGDYFGALGLMLHNRRRNRVNAVVEAVGPGAGGGQALRLRVTQCYGNCPKYIQLRDIQVDEGRLAGLAAETPHVETGGPQLGPTQREFVCRADTFFVASFCGEGPVPGLDCSHRGGSPGFVQVTPGGRLRWPDFIGNNMFQTLGNIHADGRLGLQFLDFDTGGSLQLTGRASILWDEKELPGAQRTLEFVPQRWVHTLGGLPLSSRGPVGYSPYNPVLPQGAGGPPQGQAITCTGRTAETPDITTYEFGLPPGVAGRGFCEAGQFASFDFPQVVAGETLNRTWTISRHPADVEARGAFTISVKTAGRVSAWLRDHLRPGGALTFRGVDGDFTLDRAARRLPPAGVLLVAGGIGVTPCRVMFRECLRRGVPVTLCYAVRARQDAAFLGEFAEARPFPEASTVSAAAQALAAPDKVGVCLFLSGAGGEAPEGVPGCTVLPGRLDRERLLQVCPDLRQREMFQCGPPALMDAMAAIAEGLGVASQLHQESFGF